MNATEAARRAGILVAAAAAFGAAAWAAGALLPDPVGDAVVAACERAIAEEREGSQISPLERRHDRSPAVFDEQGASEPFGDTLHEVSIAYDWQGPGDAQGSDTAWCSYVEEAGEDRFDPERLDADVAVARP